MEREARTKPGSLILCLSSLWATAFRRSEPSVAVSLPLNRELHGESTKGASMETDERAKDEGRSEDEPNPTQEQIGEGEDKPADASWNEDDWGEMPEESPLA
jgi:hypothetical protein